MKQMILDNKMNNIYIYLYKATKIREQGISPKSLFGKYHGQWTYKCVL